MQYGYLLIAVALEVCGTMLLPVSQNFTRPVPTLSLIGCYAASFYCLTFALNTLPAAYSGRRSSSRRRLRNTQSGTA